MKFKEIEFKYDASDVSLRDFNKLISGLNPVYHLNAGSYDYYYEKQENEFIRFRAGFKPELTIKVKTAKTNSFIRTELNLPLDTNKDTDDLLDTVNTFCSLLSFNPKFTIYKNCHIHYFKQWNAVYYIVYDVELKEVGRFIEIEINEGYPDTEQQAKEDLSIAEKLLAPLGITSKNRMFKNLYEIFKERLNGKY